MTVSTNTNFQTIILDGVNSSFAFTGFVGVSASNISATLRDTAGVSQSLSSVTITLNAPATGQIWGIGGTVVLPSVFPAGWTLTLVRTLDLVQSSNFTNQGNTLPALIESTLDRLTMASQQISAVANRALRPPATETFNDLPTATQRANGYLGFDSSGQPVIRDATVTLSPATLSTLSFSSAFGNLTGGQTTFAATYTPGFVLVFRNGVQLFRTQFTATNGTSVVLASGVAAADTIIIQTFTVGTFSAPGPSSIGNSQLVSMPANRIKASGFDGVTSDLSLSAVIDNALTGEADGDLLIRQSGTWNRFPVGSEAQSLNVVSGLPAWSSPVIPLRRQTVLFGPVDTSGRPSFLPATAGALSVTSQNVTSTTPLIITASNGAANRTGTRITNLTWSGLTLNRAAATPNFLFVDIAADGTMTTGSTILAPTYREGGADVVTNLQATFNISEMVMRVGNGTTAPQTWRVFVGEAATDATTVISTVAYAYQGRSLTADQTVGAAASLQTHAHNLGVQPIRAELFARCLTADLNYAIGDVVSNPSTEGGGAGYSAFTILLQRNAAILRLGSTTALRLINNTTGGLNAATSASWALFIRTDRGW